jgi:hypothetical protein
MAATVMGNTSVAVRGEKKHLVFESILSTEQLKSGCMPWLGIPLLVSYYQQVMT